MRKWPVLILGAMLVTAMPSFAQEGSSNKEKSAQAPKAPAKADVKPTPSPAPGSEDPNYVIGAEDMLDINVWKEPDVSRVVPVRPDGKISLPLLNDVQAAGLKPTELAAQITDKLHKWYNDPQVTVIVTAINSRRIYVTGEVNRPGAYPMLPDMTVLQALASTGGFTLYANKSKIYVLRTVDGKQVKLPVDYKKITNGQNPEQNVLLRPGDTIVVP
jgi:polysaccharide export outer membrane protein